MILTTFMLNNDQFNSNCIIQTFLIDNNCYFIFLSGFDCRIQPVSGFYGFDFNGIPPVSDSGFPVRYHFGFCIIVSRENVEMLRQFDIEFLIVIVQLPFHGKTGSYLCD